MPSAGDSKPPPRKRAPAKKKPRSRAIAKPLPALLDNPDAKAKLLELVTLHPEWPLRQIAEAIVPAKPARGRAAAKPPGYRRRDVKQLLEKDEDFREEYQAARGYDDDAIRTEIRRRAIEGIDEPVFHKGQVVGTIRRYSDRLLMGMAKAHLPEYRDLGRLEVTGGLTLSQLAALAMDDDDDDDDEDGVEGALTRMTSQAALPPAPEA